MEYLCILFGFFDNNREKEKKKVDRSFLFQNLRMLKTPSEFKINNQTILKEHIDEHYEPTEEEIREYALYIGIDPDKVKRRKKTRK